MTKRPFFFTLSALIVLGIVGCSSGTSLQPTIQPGAPMAHFGANTKNAQYLYVYNTGSPGIYTGEFARYSLPKLTLLETTAADGVASNEAFGKNNLPYFVDEALPSGFGVYLQPVGAHVVPAKQQFYGIPCQSSALATGPTGNFYATQYCSANVLEFKPGVLTGKPKKPIATYTGGNLTGTTYPTDAVVDRSGDLYVGDTGGGVTYFPAGSTRGTVAFKTGSGGYVDQMIVDSSGDVWSIHGPDPTLIYFQDKTHCILDPSGTVARNELAERFSKGTLVRQLYTSTTDSPFFSDNGVSIAIDSAGRVYTGNQNNGTPGVVSDYDPNQSCPNDSLSFALNVGADPQVAVDNQKRYYVTNYENNTIAAYTGGSKKLIAKVTQQTGIINIKSTTIDP